MVIPNYNCQLYLSAYDRKLTIFFYLITGATAVVEMEDIKCDNNNINNIDKITIKNYY